MALTIVIGVLVFLAAVALDWLEALYVSAVQTRRPRRAAVCSIGMYVIGCVGFFTVLEISWWYMLPECFGLYVGTTLAMGRSRTECCVP